MKEPYFDFNEEKVKIVYRDPWNASINLNGSDALTFHPEIDENSNLWCYLDEIYRTGSFAYNSTKRYNKLKVLRFVFKEDNYFNKEKNPNNAKYYSNVYNGFFNLSSVLKAPFYISRLNYSQCDNMEEVTTIQPLSNIDNPSDDDDDTRLYYETWVDIEPYTGVTLRAAQKMMISILLEKDDLFELNNNKFIPFYYLFRSGNVTENKVNITLIYIISNRKYSLICIMEL